MCTISGLDFYIAEENGNVLGKDQNELGIFSDERRKIGEKGVLL